MKPGVDSSLIPHPSSLPNSFDKLSNLRIILFGGKGGVGKTTIASLAALHFAKKRRTILFTTDPASNLSDLFTGNRQPATDNLTIEALHAEELYASFLEEHMENFLELGDRGTYLDREELRRFFELSLPGVDELMAWDRIGALAEENADATIVVDTAPTGHALRMLSSAEHFRRFGEALDAMQEKHRSMVRQFTRRDSNDAIDAFIDRFEGRARARRDLLTSDRAAFVPIFLADRWVVDQTLRLIDEVRENGLALPLAILNRATRCDCPICAQRKRADDVARKALAPLPVVDAPRSCVPLDSVAALQKYPDSGGAAAFRPPKNDGGVNAAAPLDLARLTFLAGKGGVGKTTMATSIALGLAQRNRDRRYTIISVDPAHTLRDVFADQPPPENLTVETIDTREKWRRFRETLGEEVTRAIDALAPRGMTVAYDGEAVQKLIEIAPPGADELFAITRLAALVADESVDGIIVDTAPTGHFLRLLDLPRTAGEWVREFMRILLRYRDLVPPGSLGEELVHASRALTSLQETLQSADAAVVIVTRPERIVIAETRRLVEEMERRGIAVAGVIANYITPPSDCPCDASMRSHELAALAALERDVIPIERREEPVTKLEDLAGLL